MDHHHHEENHLTNSQFITDVVIGMSDGLTVPFALAAGLSAVASSSIIVTAGLAEIVAGSIAMGLGGYLAGQTEIDHYNSELKREYEEVEKVPEIEKQEIKDVFKEYGLNANTQNLIADELAKDTNKWVKFMMKFELGLEQPDKKRATNSALTIGLSYIVGGLIPLAPYFVVEPKPGLIYSSLITIICLFIFGFLKSKATGQHPVKGALKVTLIGTIAALAAFLIAQSFN